MTLLPVLPDLEGGKAAAAAFNAAIADMNVVRHQPHPGGSPYGDLTHATGPAFPLLNGTAAVFVADRERPVDVSELAVTREWESYPGVPAGCCDGPGCEHPWPPTRDTQPWLFDAADRYRTELAAAA